MHHIPGLYVQNVAHPFIFQQLQSTVLNMLFWSSVLDSLHNDPSILWDNIYGRCEVKKKETIPVIIASAIDIGFPEGPLKCSFRFLVIC